MKIVFADSSYELTESFRQDYSSRVEASYREAAELLPFGSKHINFFVQPRAYNLIPETQDNGHAHNSEFLELAFNPEVDEKGLEIILNGVKANVYHEMNHAARFNIPIFHKTFLDGCIMEGLATAFERDYADTNPPYGLYPDNVNEWLDEIIDNEATIDRESYSFEHPDGRRWIAYKVGTYIIDKAKENSHLNVIDLTQMECLDILDLAKIKLKQSEHK